ncbi:MAG: DUF835 domain-containing protein [Methanothrix sp.]|uniref:sodium:solute symporter family transporter n=1 Tax=Methanothrix sp. TaxID=90426 RepID=UPI0025FE40F1|nr:DUF835 domain-containing protein [Methanothrix sp.]MCQ8903365.1 DUF835 domain-containing protein [Methanothrix sp.]
MSAPIFAFALLVSYLLLLSLVAYYADRQRQAGRSIVSNPYVYALSLAVYCTAWTFYGSIGRAATSGLEFLTIYIGPTFLMLLGWVMIRKIVRISKEYRLTSVSDFISFRYGRSYAIGAIVTIVSLMVVIPYVALQLIAISSSIQIISGGETFWGTKLVVAVLLGIFAIIFGARHLDPMERHEGLVAAVAFESIVKLTAFVAAGAYITWGIFGGYSEIIDRVLSTEEFAHLITIEYTSWFTLTLISFFAAFLLPRQFHVMVVENSDESHIRKAMWLFPLYLLLINLFVPAIAGAGLILNVPGVKDMFVIEIPYSMGNIPLAVLVFIGGASAATAMVLVDSVAVGHMMLNELELPHLMRYIGKGRGLPGLLLNAKRINILLVVILGYLYSRAVEYQSLVDIGLISFVAASQMGPVVIGGLYWRKGSREGAIAGMSAGFVLWVYTALIPTMVKAGWLSRSILDEGPFGIQALRPTNLFGVDLDPWTNSVFWSLLINVSLYVLISLMSSQTPEERVEAEGFVEIFSERRGAIPIERPAIRLGTVDEVESMLARYIGAEKARLLIDADLARLGVSRDRVDARHLLDLWDHAERILTGSLGTSTTRIIVEEQTIPRPVVERKGEVPPKFRLEPGRIYFSAERAYEIFTDQVTHGFEGLCVTHRHPDEVRSRFGLTETPIIWLNPKKEGREKHISPANLPLLFLTIKTFVESSKNSVILLDSLEHLVSVNENVTQEEDMLDFVNQLEGLVRRTGTRLLLADSSDFVGFCGVSKTEPVDVKGLIFTAGPLPSYLLRVFILAIIASTRSPEAAMDIANSVLREQSGISEETSCDPDMRGRGLIEIDTRCKITRRHFFTIIRRISAGVSRIDPGFDAAKVLRPLIDKFGFSIYELVLNPGTTYAIEEDKPARCFEIFSELIHAGLDGLSISRYNPETLREKYGISPEWVIWLTQKTEEGKFRSVDPTNFPRLSSMISDFLRRAEYPVILLEGIGYLITQSNYETVLRFIQSQRDEVSLRGAVMLVHIDPLSLDTKELHRLEGEMEQLKL